MASTSPPPKVRPAACVALVFVMVAALALQLGSSPGFGRQLALASHADSPRVAYLFGSGSTHGGREITLRVALTGPALAGGAEVRLRSQRPDLIPLPATVVVPAGQSTFTFSAATNPTDDDTHVRVSAGYGGRTKGREVLIREPRLGGLSVQSVIRAEGMGRLTVCLTGAAPVGGIAVSLSGNDPAAFMVPATIIIPAGVRCRSIAVSAGAVTADTPVLVSARYKGVSRFRDTTVRILSSPVPPTVTETASPTSTSTDTATAIPTSTEPPTATATSTKVGTTLSAGCQAMNNPDLDGVYVGNTTGTSLSWNAGEVVILTTSRPENASTVIAAVELNYGSIIESDFSSIPGTIELVAPMSAGASASWSTGAGTAEWAVSCEAGPDEPTATATATIAPGTLSTGCQALNDPSFDGVYVGFQPDHSFSFSAGEVISLQVSGPEDDQTVIAAFELRFNNTIETDFALIPGTITFVVPTTIEFAAMAWTTGAGTVSWTISCGNGLEEPTPMATATSTEVAPTLSDGCALLASGYGDGSFPGGSTTNLLWNACDTITISASEPGTATGILVTIEKDGGIVTLAADFPGMIEYTMLETGGATLSWGRTGSTSPVTWTVECEARSDDEPTATASATPTSTEFPSPLSQGCSLLASGFGDGLFLGGTSTSMLWNTGERISITAAEPGSATGIVFTFEAGGEPVSLTAAFPGTITYTVPASGGATASWGRTGSTEAVTWAVDCVAGSATQPTATNTAIPTASASVTVTPSATPTSTAVPTGTSTSTPALTATNTTVPEVPVGTATATPVPNSTATNTPEPTATRTPEPTATSTNVPAATATRTFPALSSGCELLASGVGDQFSGGGSTGLYDWFAGETITIRADEPGSAEGISFTFDSSSGSDPILTAPFPGEIVYTVTETDYATASWTRIGGTAQGGATWTLACEGPAGD